MSKPITEYSWDELYAYEFDSGMETITIITTADRETIGKLFSEWKNEENFATFVASRGYPTIDAMSSGRLN